MLDHGTPEHAVADPIESLRHRMRHSAAHIMADAVLQLFPDAKVGIGPPTADGFYYDFDVDQPFTPEDLERIESLMLDTIRANAPFVREELSRDSAKSMFSSQPYKQEIIDDLPDETTLSIYRHGEFTDLCQGPHVASAGDVTAVKLLNVAGAYWRGDENRPMLQRIYGTAFESEQELEAHLERLAEAERRDHRTLGRQLNLFTVHEEIGPGLIVWHPKGGIMRSLIEDYWRDIHYRRGYNIVYSPHIGRARLWQTSGHLDFYRDSMYAPMEIDDQEYFLRPMNCPFHIQVYRSSLRSYRELPLRIAELGTVYRYERSGVLHGLMRVRGFTQDDAHIFCLPDQVAAEVGDVLDLTFEIMSAFGFEEYDIMLSTRPEKYVGNPIRGTMPPNRCARLWSRVTSPTPLTMAAAPSMAPRSTSRSRTRWAGTGSAPPSSSTSTCPNASISSFRTTRATAPGPTWSTAPSWVLWNASSVSSSSTTPEHFRSGSLRSRRSSFPSPTATTSTPNQSPPSYATPASAWRSTTAASE